MKYNKSEIMKAAWKTYNMSKRWVASYQKTFGECLKAAWANAKKEIGNAVAKVAQAIKRMHYSEYKNNYAHCKTVADSYDKKTKTIEVYTANTVAALCPKCRTYCYGDCMAR